MRKVIFVVITLLYALNANAEDYLIFSSSMEPSINAGLAYKHNLKFDNYDIDLKAGIELPMAHIVELDTLSIQTGVGFTPYLQKIRPFGTKLELISDLIVTNNALGEFTSLGGEFSIKPGLYFNKWYLSLDITYLFSVLTHIKHSALANSSFKERYPDNVQKTTEAKDGWYFNGANHFQFGLEIKVPLFKNFNLLLSGGYSFVPNTLGISNHGINGMLPYYGELLFVAKL